MRIVSGKHKSRRITAPNNLPVRPTTDMAKEALFNILNNRYYFDQIEVLDLFAGIGSISFEFASRGTKKIISVDQHQGCINFLNRINNELELDIQTIKSDVYSFLDKTNKRFDVIFADPPYDFTEVQFQKIIDSVFDNQLLLEDGMLIIEHSKQTNLSQNITFIKSKKYGGNMFSFFENETIEK
ncbi:MAG: 16S rRNA (guanine(966)-N(2))-methyltransferase RsmD [Flavobacteriaceae bacterium]|nr:16S rRNA (guanine(966)-N(2))-methyltransferase RsmD [Flavobacteriaceae bacterium]